MKRLFILLLALFCSSPAWAWTHNETVANAPGTSGSTRSMTITSTTAGQTICIGIVAQTGSGTPAVSSVTDNKGGGSSTYTALVTFTHAGDSNLQAIYCTNGAASGITSTTCTMTASQTNFLDCYVSVFTPTGGLTLSFETGISTTNFGTSASIATTAFTPTGSDNLILVIAQAPTASGTPSNSYVLASSTDGNAWAYKLGQGNASTSTAITTTSGQWWVATGDVKGVASGGGTSIKPPVIL